VTLYHTKNFTRSSFYLTTIRPASLQIIVLMIDAFCCKKFEAIGESGTTTTTNNNNNKFEDFRYKPVFKQEQEEVGMHTRSVVVSAERIAKRCNVAIAPPHGSNSGVTLCLCPCLCVCLSVSLSLQSLSAKRCTRLRFALAWRVWYLLTDFFIHSFDLFQSTLFSFLGSALQDRETLGYTQKWTKSLVSLHFLGSCGVHYRNISSINQLSTRASPC